VESDIQEYLKPQLAQVRRHRDTAFRVEGTLMGEVARYVGGRSGKMLRPALVSLSARAFGYDGTGDHDTLLGAAVELFHLATLLHDDVIDKAPLRRGRPTVCARWGDDVAILFADYLYATSFDFALEVLDPEVVRVLSKTTQKMASGELYQIEKRGEWLSIEDYYNIIQSKTAHLFSASAGLGAIIAGEKGENVERMFRFGLNFGMAFQITDDALDYEASGEAWGKRLGGDLEEGKQTLPLLHALRHGTPEDRAALVAALNNGRDFETVHAIVRRTNSIDYSLERAAEYTRAAQDAIAGLPDSEPLGHLRRLTETVLVRQH